MPAAINAIWNGRAGTLSRNPIAKRFQEEGIESLQKIYKVDINFAGAGLSQSTRIVAPEEEAIGETPQEVQDIQEQTARFFFDDFTQSSSIGKPMNLHKLKQI